MLIRNEIRPHDLDFLHLQLLSDACEVFPRGLDLTICGEIANERQRATETKSPSTVNLARNAQLITELRVSHSLGIEREFMRSLQGIMPPRQRKVASSVCEACQCVELQARKQVLHA